MASTRIRQEKDPNKKALDNQIQNRNYLAPTGFKFIISRAPKISYFGNQVNLPSLTLDIANQPSYLKNMLDQKWLGQKTGQGFYKKIDKGVIHSINLETMEYGPMNKNRYDAIALAKEKTYLNDKINAIVRSDDVAGEFLWSTISKSLLYSANIGMKISDDIVSVDSALKWGFGWELGPFEVLDAIGLEYFVNRLKQEGKKCSDWLMEMIQWT